MQETQYFSDIRDFPLHNWLKCQEGKLQYCRSNWTDEPAGEKETEVWVSLQNQFLEIIGPGKTQQKYLDLIDEETDLICEYLETGERFLLNRVRQLKYAINSLIDEPEETDFDQILVLVGKWYSGKPLRAKEINVIEFHKIIDLYGRENRTN